LRRRCLLAVALLAATGTAATARVSPSSERTRTFSFRPWLSADGRLVAYDSDAGGSRDVFVFHRSSGRTERVTAGNGESLRPVISAGGRYVAFWSKATDLVEGDTNRRADVFVFDRASRTTVRVSVAGDGTQGDGDSARPVVSGDGRLVAFESSAGNLAPGSGKGRRVFVRDLVAGTTTLVADGLRPSISDDGTAVAFNSDAALVPGDTNGTSDVYVRDLVSGSTTRVSVAGGGTQVKGGSYSPALSSDGRSVAFWSSAADLVAGDTNRVDDVFVHDRSTGRTTRVSVGSDGKQADGLSTDPHLSGDGRWVAFWSSATNLAPGDRNRRADVFVHDRSTGATTRESVASDGTDSDGHTYSPNLSAGGEVVAFDSLATNLVEGERNRGSAVYVRVRSG
jgi:Tol biopolymer transport system component